MRRFTLPLTLALLLLLVLPACTDTQIAGFKSIGEPHRLIHLTTHGDTLGVYRSTGIPQNEESSDGYKFMDKSTNRIVRVSGGIIIIVPES